MSKMFEIALATGRAIVVECDGIDEYREGGALNVDLIGCREIPDIEEQPEQEDIARRDE